MIGKPAALHTYNARHAHGRHDDRYGALQQEKESKGENLMVGLSISNASTYPLMA